MNKNVTELEAQMKLIREKWIDYAFQPLMSYHAFCHTYLVTWLSVYRP